MGENIYAQYEAVINYLNQYRKWKVRIDRRTSFFLAFMKVFSRTFRMFNIFKEFKELELFSEKQSSMAIEFITKITSKEERESNFFKIRTSDYIIDALSREIEKKFSEVNFRQLSKLHELQFKKLSRRNYKSIIVVVFGLGTLLLRTVPEVVINQFWNYATFQIWTFWIMIVLLAYLGLGLLPEWLEYYNTKMKYNWIGNILSYTEIRINSK